MGPRLGFIQPVWTRMFPGQERVGYRSGIVEDRAPGEGSSEKAGPDGAVTVKVLDQGHGLG